MNNTNEPFAALERELPSLKVDLKLSAQQVESWSLFERDVKELAQLDRVRRRQLLALRDSDAPLPSASKLLAMFADGDRQKAEASADMKRHFETLYALLDPTQQHTVDRRVALSQTEPLSLEPTPKR